MRWAFIIFCYLWRSKQYAMMDLKTIRTELHKLTAIVDGWDPSGHIPALERDLALEKLRTLYDAVRFAEGASVAEALVEAEEPAAAAPVAIDLGAVLSLDPEDGAGFESDSDAAPGSAFEAEPEPEPVEAFSGPDMAAEPGSAEAFAGPEPESETGLEPEPEPSEMQEMPETTVPEPEPVFEAGPAPEPEVEPAPEPETEPAPVFVAEEPEPSAELDESVEEPASALTPGADPVPAAEAAGESVPEPVAAEKPQYIAPTLFGLEEETVRHRHKQRVIMSLYDTPAPAEKPTAPEVAETRPEPVAVPEPKIEPAPAELERQQPEIRESHEFRPVAEPEEESEFEEVEIAAPAGAVLGDVINHDVQTLADTIAPHRGAASELRRGEPVADLRRAIGINDKFLLIRDLFGGDGEAYEQAIGTLNAFDDFDECMIYIAENYAWNPNSDGAKFMMELLERKFS